MFSFIYKVLYVFSFLFINIVEVLIAHILRIIIVLIVSDFFQLIFSNQISFSLTLNLNLKFPHSNYLFAYFYQLVNRKVFLFFT
jgi:hypothetical protein